MPRNQTAEELGISIGTIVRITRDGRAYNAVTVDGTSVVDKIDSYALKNAFRANKALRLDATKVGGTMWKMVPQVEFDKLARGEIVKSADSDNVNIVSAESDVEGFDTHADFVDYIKGSMDFKPRKLKIPEMAWKFAVRTVLRGKNMLVVGPSGCGKTLLAGALKVALGREDRYFYVNLGATQDPRSTLIGNTHFDKTTGTYVALSYFAQAIQVPNALILLDEVSRAHPEAHNILMTVLDYTQRYLRVDEKADSETVRVAPGVTFILTANVGSEYTATRTMDRALLDRCTMFEMQPLNKEDELTNLRECYSEVEDKVLTAIAEIATKTRMEAKSETPRVDTILSTRMSEELASAIYDGFSLAEGAEMYIFPFFSDAGGAESPRAFMRALVQQFLPAETDGKKTPFKGGDPKANNGRPTPW
jgi:MoxR-like ATPase